MTDKLYLTNHDTKPCHDVSPVRSVDACIGPDLPGRQGLVNIKGKRKGRFGGGGVNEVARAMGPAFITSKPARIRNSDK